MSTFDELDFERGRVGGISFSVTNLKLATDWVINEAASQSPSPQAITLSNSWCVALAASDSEYEQVLKSEDVTVFPDGTPVVWALRLAGKRIAGRVRGPSLFRQVLDRGRAKNLRHYFVGSTEDTLQALTSRVIREYPGIIVAGSYSPPFAPVSSGLVEEIAARVRKSDANVVWVGMGTPKQDFVSARLAPLVLIPVAGVGAAFDFVAGTTGEAPVWVQHSGFEWLHRLVSEPRRLWRRYVFGNVQFLLAVGKSWRNDRRAS